MALKRQRTVQGTCWPCKQRRVKCDLSRPRCGRCILSGAKCSYDKILVRWNSRPTKSAPIDYQTTAASSSIMNMKMSLNKQPSDKTFEIGELRALDYFQATLWPLLTTATRPCPPPISLALESQPVLLAMCELAEAHRALQLEKWTACDRDNSNNNNDDDYDDDDDLQCNKRLSCLASVREQLCQSVSNTESLSRLLVAVLLLYFLDGFIDCAQQSASTASHQAGVRAIVDHLGGFTALLDKGQKDTNMLLSEFASTDLTRALLDDRPPCFPPDIWLKIESGTVWWEKQTYGTMTLASVFRTMAQMAFYRQSLKTSGDATLSIEKVQAFERCLQPVFLILNLDHVNCPDAYTVPESSLTQVSQPIAFTRAFQHSALIYLYRAVCGLPPLHYLVQQHVESCMECIKGISRSSKAHNCIIFPLYVIGAHAFTAEHRTYILQKLDCIYQSLRFNSLLSIRAALEELWGSERQQGGWGDMFTCLGRDVLVL